MSAILLRTLTAASLAILLAAPPALAQSKSIEDALGGEKAQEIKPDKKQGGDGAEVKPDGEGDQGRGGQGQGGQGQGGQGSEVKPDSGGQGARPESSPGRGPVRSATNPNCDPTFGGRYADLVRKLYIPRDRRQYGMCRNWGRWNGTRYRGFRFRSGLYWTYDGTHWYLFATRLR